MLLSDVKCEWELLTENMFESFLLNFFANVVLIFFPPYLSYGVELAAGLSITLPYVKV